MHACMCIYLWRERVYCFIKSKHICIHVKQEKSNYKVRTAFDRNFYSEASERAVKNPSVKRQVRNLSISIFLQQTLEQVSGGMFVYQ